MKKLLKPTPTFGVPAYLRGTSNTVYFRVYDVVPTPLPYVR